MDKKTFRIKCLKKLKNIPGDRMYISDKLVMQKIDNVIMIHKPKSILFYMPMALEVDVQNLIKIHRKKLKVYVPFIEGESFKMVYYRLPLRRNSYNIFEPPNSKKKIKDIDMIIVPVIGIDKDFRRVGFGKGMYDRFYEKLDNKPIVVFVQRQECKCKMKITQSYDIQADYYITPKELKMIGKIDDNRDTNSRNWGFDRRSSSIF